jgi:O-antigen/teichoic acid export membrane protein
MTSAPLAIAQQETRSSAVRILTALAQLGAAQAAVGVAGLVRNKAMALALKPAGFGEFTQLAGIALAVYTFAQFGMQVGLSRNAAAAENRGERQRQLGAANWLTITLAIACLAILVPVVLTPAGDRLLSWLGVYPGFAQKSLLVILLAVAPVEALRTNYMSFLQGVGDIKGLSSSRALAVLAAAALVFPLVFWLGATGAGIYTMLAAVFLAVLLGRRCAAIGYRPLAFRGDRGAMMTLAALGGAALISGVSLNGTETLIRAHLIAYAGAAENGLYQAALLISGTVTNVILGSIGAYSLATLSQTREAAAGEKCMHELLGVVLPVAALSLGALGLLCYPVLSLLYSHDFLASAKFLPLLLGANYIQAVSWVAGAPLLGFGMVRTWTAIQLSGAAIRYTATIFSLPWLGAFAVPAGLLAAMTFDLAANIVVCRACLGMRFERRMVLIGLAGAAAVADSALIGSGAPSWILLTGGAVQLAAITVAMSWTEILKWRKTA